MSDTIRVGVIGAGRNTKLHHIPKLQAIDGVEVVSVTNRSRASSERVAEEFGIPTVYDNWWELMEAEDTDAIVIGTWPYMHHTLTLAALAANKHVMVEARMARNAQEAHDMWAAAKAKPYLITQIVPSPYSLRADNTIKRLLAEGYLGDVLAIEVRQNGPFINRDAPLHWRESFDLSGLNIMSMGILYEAILRWVGEATQVVAMGKTFTTTRLDEETGLMASIRIPDHLDIIASMACGAQAHFGISAVTGLESGNSMVLFGSEGTLRFAGGKLYGQQRGEESLQEIEIPAEEVGGWRVEAEFVSAIQGKEVITHTSFETGVKYMEFTEAVNRSLAEGVAISLPL